LVRPLVDRNHVEVYRLRKVIRQIDVWERKKIYCNRRSCTFGSLVARARSKRRARLSCVPYMCSIFKYASHTFCFSRVSRQWIRWSTVQPRTTPRRQQNRMSKDSRESLTSRARSAIFRAFSTCPRERTCAMYRTHTSEELGDAIRSLSKSSAVSGGRSASALSKANPPE
jgi:hypothetical protein